LGAHFFFLTGASSEACLDEATWDGNTVPLMYREYVSVPWASVTAVPSVVASFYTSLFTHREVFFVCFFVC